MITNSYSAEFGKASGGVVNIVTKSGTNEFRGNAFWYFRDKSLNAKDHFEKFDVFGNPIDRDEGALRVEPVRGHPRRAPSRRTRRSSSSPSSGPTSRPPTSSPSTPTAAALLNASGFPVETGRVPYDYKTSELLGKVDHQWSPNSSLAFRANYSDTTNENIEPFGGLVAKSRGAVQLRKDWSLSAFADERALAAVGERSPGAGGEAGPGDQLPRPEVRRGLPAATTRAARPWRSPASRPWAGSASRPSPGRTPGSSSRRRSASSRASHSAKAGSTSTPSARRTTATRCRSTSAGATSSPPCPRSRA